MAKAYLEVEASDLKMMRETLCLVQSMHIRLNAAGHLTAETRHLQTLINEIDKHRPLGSNGKHGTLHTPTCGCEDLEETTKLCPNCEGLLYIRATKCPHCRADYDLVLGVIKE